jgi:hypothetical protein
MTGTDLVPLTASAAEDRLQHRQADRPAGGPAVIWYCAVFGNQNMF